MDSKTKTSEQTILYGKWPIDPDNPGEAIQVSQILESQGVDWFPKDSLILVKVSDMIKIWDQGELQLSQGYLERRRPRRYCSQMISILSFKNLVMLVSKFSVVEGLLIWKSGRVVAWTGFRDEATMIDCMKKFFDYQE